MQRYIVELKVSAGIDAFTPSDAIEIVQEAIKDVDGLGVEVYEITLDSVTEA